MVPKWMLCGAPRVGLVTGCLGHSFESVTCISDFVSERDLWISSLALTASGLPLALALGSSF